MFLSASIRHPVASSTKTCMPAHAQQVVALWKDFLASGDDQDHKESPAPAWGLCVRRNRPIRMRDRHSLKISLASGNFCLKDPRRFMLNAMTTTEIPLKTVAIQTIIRAYTTTQTHYRPGMRAYALTPRFQR